MPDIERLEFIETTAFKERKQTIDKVNEIIDYINTELDYLRNPIKKIPLTLTLEIQQDTQQYQYKFVEDIKDDDLIIINGRDKREGYNVLNFSVCLSSKVDYRHTYSLGIISSDYMDCDTTNGLYIAFHRIYFDITSKNIRLYRDTVSFKSLSVNTKVSTNISNNFDISAYIIRGVE